MNDIEISVAQAKKEFTKIIRETSQSEFNFIISERGTPVAVIMSFEGHRKLKKRAVYAELMGLRKRLFKSGVSAQEVYRKSKKMLEEGQ